MQKIKRRSWLIYRLCLVTPEKTNILYPFPPCFLVTLEGQWSPHQKARALRRVADELSTLLPVPWCWTKEMEHSPWFGSYVWNMVKPQLPCEDVSFFPGFCSNMLCKLFAFHLDLEGNISCSYCESRDFVIKQPGSRGSHYMTHDREIRLGTFLETLISRRIHVWYIHLHLP